MSTTSFKKGDRVRWTGKAKFGDGSTFASDYPSKVGLLGTIDDPNVRGRGASVKWDNGEPGTMVFYDNLELVEPFPVGARFVFNDPKWPDNPWNGKSGVVTGAPGKTHRTVKMECEPDHIGQSSDIKYMTEKETKTVANFKNIVKSTLDTLLVVAAGESAKDQAVRRLGIASALATRAESEKKAAKTKLKELGVIRDEYDASTTETIFDSERYTMDAVTNAGSQRLEATALEAALLAEGISGVKRTRIMNAAMVPTKPATSFKVEAK